MPEIIATYVRRSWLNQPATLGNFNGFANIHQRALIRGAIERRFLLLRTAADCFDAIL
jgi:hypothetical protein